MNILPLVLIYAGSALMALCIVRYSLFYKSMTSSGSWQQIKGFMASPLVLIVLFFIGYLSVALFGEPDMVVASILFGGSIFVFIVFHAIFLIIRRMRETNARSTALYNETVSNIDAMANDYLTVARVNLTKDTIIKIAGTNLIEADRNAKTYSDFMARRKRNLITVPDTGMNRSGVLTRESLIESYKKGRTTVEEKLLCQLYNGQACFIKTQVSLVEKLDTGDIEAFITESNCNDEVVNDVLLGKALSEQYDMIAYLAGGRYGVVIGEDGGTSEGSIFPLEKNGEYDSWLEERVVPVLDGTDEEKTAARAALDMQEVERQLTVHEPYEVNISCFINGKTFNKRCVFYIVDPVAKFYLLLKSDTTAARREEQERSRALEEALEKAQRASRAKTAFLSNMSHDIRTPMNAIVGYTEFAKKSDDIEQVHQYLEKIDTSSKYLLALINDVLEMSRIESGKLDLVLESTDLVRIVHDARNVFEAQMREKGIDFTVDTSQIKDSVVKCDRSRFDRVLLNLLSNAYKFTPEGGSVIVTLKQVDGAPAGFGDYELRVKDTGIGMSEEFAAKVFNAFERERNSTISGIQGTGLGTAITKRIVDMMGGSIDVSTAQDEGTEFIVRVRFELPEGSSSGANGAYLNQQPAENADFTGMRALLAEDNEINREIAGIVLEDLGFDYDTAVNGQEAVDMLCAADPGHYDIVITDIQMPVMDGYEEARAIRALDDPMLANIPIIAMSANAFAEDRQASSEAGMNGHVAKPIDIDDLTGTLAQVLARTQL